jgi:hypothetical protein
MSEIMVKTSGNCAPSAKPMIADAKYIEYSKGNEMRSRLMDEKKKRTADNIRGRGTLYFITSFSDMNPHNTRLAKFHKLISAIKVIIVLGLY